MKKFLILLLSATIFLTSCVKSNYTILTSHGDYVDKHYTNSYIINANGCIIFNEVRCDKKKNTICGPYRIIENK